MRVSRALRKTALPINASMSGLTGETLEPANLRRAVRALKAADPKLARVIEAVGPCRLAPTEHSPFHALFRSIVYQQLSGKAAATILGRVVALFAPPFPKPQAVLAQDEASMRAAGLSANKLRALRDLSEKTLSGVVPKRAALAALTDEEIIERCTAVRGVGQWTVEMMLMFHLGRPDVLPVDDLGIRKGAMKVYGLRKLPDAARLEKLAAPWRPWRSVGSWYLWRVLELP